VEARVNEHRSLAEVAGNHMRFHPHYLNPVPDFLASGRYQILSK